MKILRVIASMDPASGGPCQGIRNAIPEQTQMDVHNEVVCMDNPQSSFLGKDEFAIHALGPSKGPWQKSTALMPWLISNLKRFDVVIVHGLWLYHGYAVRKAMRAIKASGQQAVPRWYVMPHGMLDPYFQKVSGRKIKALRNAVYWKFIESKIVNDATGVLFTTQQEMELAEIPFKPYHPKQRLNVGYGIAKPPSCNNIPLIELSTAYPFLKQPGYLLFLSRIHEKKGVDMLINAYEKMLSINAALPKLVIAGPGLEMEFGQLLVKKVAESKTLSQQIVFPGMMTGNAKWAAFYHAGAFVLPSHQENFGISVAEALACGKPVLISDQVNICQAIKADHAGILQPDTEEGTYQLLSLYINMSNNQCEIMSANARKCFEDRYSISVAAKSFIEAIA